MIFAPLISCRLSRLFTFALALLVAGPLLAAERRVETAFGEVSLNGTPQRVVALGENALDVALALGFQPVGTLASRGGTEISEYLRNAPGRSPWPAAYASRILKPYSVSSRT